MIHRQSAGDGLAADNAFVFFPTSLLRDSIQYVETGSLLCRNFLTLMQAIPMPKAKKALPLIREMKQRENETTEQSFIKDKGQTMRKSTASGRDAHKQKATRLTAR